MYSTNIAQLPVNQQKDKSIVPGVPGDWDKQGSFSNPDWFNIWYSDEFTSSVDASAYFINNKDIIRENLVRLFVTKTLGRAIGETNQKYGFAPTKGQEIIWNSDSRKHPENEAFQKACTKIKEVFSEMRFNESSEQIVATLSPTIAYFEGLKSKYASDDKTDKKLRYASFYNLAFLYYYLDMPDKAIEKANELIKNDYDEKDGKAWVTKATELKKVMELNQVKTTHLAIEEI